MWSYITMPIVSEKTYALIPARMESSRLPGKPLLDLCGLPMIVHVALRTKLSDAIDEVIVCTDSLEIIATCRKFDIKCCLTSSRHKNGTERIAQASELLSIPPDALIMDVQGDEPLVDPNILNTVAQLARRHIRNGADIFLPFIEGAAFGNFNIVKIIESKGQVLYLTRSDAPHPFIGNVQQKKHFSVIGFTQNSLQKFVSAEMGPLEKVEGIELLRALESGLRITTEQVVCESFSVDVEDDLLRARRALSRCNHFTEGYGNVVLKHD